MSHEHNIERFFSANASEYAKSKSHSKGNDLFTLMNRLKPSSNDTAADFACGTGFTAVEMASKVTKVYAIDTTTAMVDEAKKLAIKRGIQNITFLIEDVTKTSLESESIDLITCRRAAHHFVDKIAFLKESKRVLKKNGKFALVDMIRLSEDNKDILNRMEKIRDKSHFYAAKELEWTNMITEEGFIIESINIETDERSYSDWLSPVKLETEEDRECKKLLSESDTKDCLNAGFDRENMKFTKSRMILIASRRG
ncbi:MAG: class I SAM-dependent methyltransferase [Thermoplasmataceae archaeon]